MDILQVKNLTKKFGSFTAVDDISFSLKEGEILGLLGPNGAGKTTTIQMLLGVLTPTSGEVIYFGKNLKNHREKILEELNFSSTYTNLPWDLTVKENLTYISYLYDIEKRKQKIEKLVEIFKLKDLFNLQISQLSAGELTRVNLAKAFINYPKILLLDEPTASLDPDVASYIRSFLLEERGKFNVSIIITSHNMTEVEEVCDRVIFINEGKIIANDTPDQLTKSIEICHVELLIQEEIDKVKEYCKTRNIKYIAKGKHITADLKEREIAGFLQDLMNNKLYYTEISIEKPTLEDYFLQAAQKKL